MRFIAAADIHIGRLPSVPEEHSGANCRGAWVAIVEYGISKGADVQGRVSLEAFRCTRLGLTVILLPKASLCPNPANPRPIKLNPVPT